MMVYEIEDRDSAAPVFGDWEESVIWSCLQGVMGHIYGNKKDRPDSAMAILGDFCFYAGKPDRELAAYRPEWCTQDFIIAVPQDFQWGQEIEKHYKDSARKVTRYAMKKEPDVFGRDRLADLVKALPDGYTLEPIEEAVYQYCKRESWCRDFVSQFPDYSFYQKAGLGIVAKKDGIPVSGASSYSAYLGGIEIEIDTKEEYRRKGLALACGARLILECLHRGLYPSWDAQNLWSVSLAEKLGYHFDHEYVAYEISGYGGEKTASGSNNYFCDSPTFIPGCML